MLLVLNAQEHIVRPFNFCVDFDYTFWTKNSWSCMINALFGFEDSFERNDEFEEKESEK